MNPTPKILFLFIISNLLYSQSSINGLIRDNNTNEPLAGVNVFISETSWGTSTDKEGRYEINNIPHGKHEIVYSMIGYKIETKEIYLKRNEVSKINIKLRPKVYDLETVEVVNKIDDDWRNDIKIFKSLFLGTSEFSEGCTIENEEYINLTRGKDDELFATSERPIVIINESLGYKVEVILQYFKWDTIAGRLRYSIKPKFTELESKNSEQINSWKHNRDMAFYGSVNHFMKTLINNKVKENGYLLFLAPSLEDKKVFASLRATEITKIDTIFIMSHNSAEYNLKFNNYLVIEYEREAGSELETTWMKLNYPEVTIDEFGYPEESMPFLTIGRWANLGLADWLPKYYKTQTNIN